MSITLGNWIIIAVVAAVGIFISVACFLDSENGLGSLALGATVLIIIGMIAGFNWYNTSTASGLRAYKDYQSELTNGMEREITITAEDGREIFHYEGKVDIESNHEDNYIKFESEEGKRFIIYYGITDTIIIEEK